MAEITINGTVLASKYNKGKSYELLLSDPTAFISTDKPVYVFQLTGTGTEAAGTSLPSIECTGSQSVSFVRPNSSEFYLNLFCSNLIIASSNILNLKSFFFLKSSIVALLISFFSNILSPRSN